MLFSQLFNTNDGLTNIRGTNNCFVVSKKIHRDGVTITFFVRTIRNPQDGGRNLVTVRPRFRKKTIQLLMKKDPTITLGQLPVTVFCTCKAFQYWGSAYNLSSLKAKIGTTESREPVVRDPEHKNKLCKHLAKVYSRFKNIPLTELYGQSAL